MKYEIYMKYIIDQLIALKKALIIERKISPKNKSLIVDVLILLNNKFLMIDLLMALKINL